MSLHAFPQILVIWELQNFVHGKATQIGQCVGNVHIPTKVTCFIFSWKVLDVTYTMQYY
jgi:hypothetical protein